MRDQYTRPFRGIIYNKERIGDIASCVCPPYDVISDDSTYLKKSPFNAVRIELPRSFHGVDQYISARTTFDKWYDSGILVMDNRETVYIYEQEFTINGTEYVRRGFIGLNKLEKERILTHEQTRKKAKEDREKLIRTLGAFTSLVFGLYEDETFKIDELLGNAEREIIFDFVDEESIVNRFWRMTRLEEVDRLSSLMNARKIYVADGHHRLDVSYRLNVPYIPLYLTNMYSRGIVILPYHRMITLGEKKPLSFLLSSLDRYVAVKRLPFSSQDMANVLHEVASSELPSFALYSKDDPKNIYVLSVTAPLPEMGSGPLGSLKVNILHTGILKGLLGIKDEEISFTQDPKELIGFVQNGSIDMAFLLPPTTANEVKEVADQGLDMPPKSTFFYPKILTGLVFHRYA